MSVDSRVNAGVLYIDVRGRFDFSVHAQFADAIKLAESGVTAIEVDLANTDYLDSSALGMLLMLRDRLAGDKKNLRIKNAKNDVKKILEIVNFEKLFTLS